MNGLPCALMAVTSSGALLSRLENERINLTISLCCFAWDLSKQPDYHLTFIKHAIASPVLPGSALLKLLKAVADCAL